jgi:hypothetical protein
VAKQAPGFGWPEVDTEHLRGFVDRLVATFDTFRATA